MSPGPGRSGGEAGTDPITGVWSETPSQLISSLLPPLASVGGRREPVGWWPAPSPGGPRWGRGWGSGWATNWIRQIIVLPSSQKGNDSLDILSRAQANT